MLKIQSLAFSYDDGGFHLQIPEFIMKPGERVAVIGPSGSGKTTLLNLISGITIPERGTIVIDEEEVNRLEDQARRRFRLRNIGFVFQDFELLDYLSVLDNILHPYRIGGVLKLDRSVRERASRLASRLGVADKLQRYPGRLSQGERQRVAICRALLPKRKLVLADEATGNLDPENKIRILDLLFESAGEQDAALLAVTHDHELLTRFDRVVDFRLFRGENSG
ncbi:MAG: ABC transporter ATP-binding protein [Gammaproteobacteria bacterium]|nr:ABC transporter ATP-binding protein [Gammaproteobacteria bacterium]